MCNIGRLCCGLDLANCRNCDEKAIQVHKLLHFPNCQTLCLCRQTMIHRHKVKTQSSSPKRHRYQDPGGLEFSSADSHASSPHKLPLVDYHSSSQRLSDIPQPFWHKSAKFSWKQCFTKVSSVQSKQYGEEYTWPSISISWVSALLLPTKQSEES